MFLFYIAGILYFLKGTSAVELNACLRTQQDDVYFVASTDSLRLNIALWGARNTTCNCYLTSDIQKTVNVHATLLQNLTCNSPSTNCNSLLFWYCNFTNPVCGDQHRFESAVNVELSSFSDYQQILLSIEGISSNISDYGALGHIDFTYSQDTYVKISCQKLTSLDNLPSPPNNRDGITTSTKAQHLSTTSVSSTTPTTSPQRTTSDIRTTATSSTSTSLHMTSSTLERFSTEYPPSRATTTMMGEVSSQTPEAPQEVTSKSNSSNIILYVGIALGLTLFICGITICGAVIVSKRREKTSLLHQPVSNHYSPTPTVMRKPVRFATSADMELDDVYSPVNNINQPDQGQNSSVVTNLANPVYAVVQKTPTSQLQENLTPEIEQMHENEVYEVTDAILRESQLEPTNMDGDRNQPYEDSSKNSDPIQHRDILDGSQFEHHDVYNVRIDVQ